MSELPGSIDLVAERPVLDVPGLIASVLAALLRPVRLLLSVRVLDPVPGVVDGAEAEVDADVRLRVDHRGVAEELVGAEAVGFDVVPGELEARRTLVLRTDAVSPVVAGAEVAARPSQDRDVQAADRFEHVLAEPVRVRERAAFLVDPAVNHAAEVLGEVAEEQRVDFADRAVDIDLDPGRGRRGLAFKVDGQRLGGQGGQDKGEAPQDAHQSPVARRTCKRYHSASDVNDYSAGQWA